MCQERRLTSIDRMLSTYGDPNGRVKAVQLKVQRPSKGFVLRSPRTNMKKSKRASSSKHNDAVGVAGAAVLRWDMGMLEISVGTCRHQIIEATV